MITINIILLILAAFILWPFSVGIADGVKVAKIDCNGLKPVNGKFIPINTEKPPERKIDPFTEELTWRYQSQIEDLEELTRQLTKMYWDADAPKKVIIKKQIIANHDKIIKVRKAMEKLKYN